MRVLALVAVLVAWSRAEAGGLADDAIASAPQTVDDVCRSVASATCQKLSACGQPDTKSWCPALIRYGCCVSTGRCDDPTGATKRDVAECAADILAGSCKMPAIASCRGLTAPPEPEPEPELALASTPAVSVTSVRPPPADDWWCTDSRHHVGNSVCYREEFRCDGFRASMQEHGWVYEECQSQPRAACFYYWDKLAKKTGWSCAASLTACHDSREFMRKHRGRDYGRLSKCKGVD